MTTPAPLTVAPPSVPVFVEVLAALGRQASVSPNSAPQQATLHLARILVAVAERHAVAAELGCGPDGLDGHDVDTHQDTYDTATVRATFERLALAHWRSRRLVGPPSPPCVRRWSVTDPIPTTRTPTSSRKRTGWR